MSGEAFVLAIDQGTTRTRAILFDREGNERASAQTPLTQIYPAPGLVERVIASIVWPITGVALLFGLKFTGIWRRLRAECRDTPTRLSRSSPR